MNERKTAADFADETSSENNSLGVGNSDVAPSTNGDQNGLTDSSNGAMPEPVNFLEKHEPHIGPNDAPSTSRGDGHALLEDRIRRLEEALALLNELKERQARESVPPPPTAQVAPVAQIVPQPPAPITTTPTDAASSFLFQVGKQMLTTTPLTAVTQPAHPMQQSTFAAGMRWTVLFFDAYAELRVIFRMFVDPRYRMSWTSRLVPLILALLLLTSGWWAPGAMLPWIGTLIDKLIDLPLAFLFFKVLSHEARRYRQTSPDLAPALRLPPDR